MAFSVSSLGKIQEQIKSAIGDAFGIGSNATGDGDKGEDLFQPEYFGSVNLDPSKWTGNAYPAANRKLLRYGFAIMESTGVGQLKLSGAKTFFLQIPPQSLQQREIFATNVQATRKGVIVESEGVVFKDIVLSGNTGIYPGERASGLNPIPNFSNPLTAPKPAAGVDPETGKSQRAEIKTISGYQEFLALRQFFLMYAKMKVEYKGKHFFGFINEKDNQYLIVEPMEFTLDRNARSPLTYDYRIVLKAIGSIDDTISSGEDSEELGILQSVINVSSNISATLAASKATIDNFEGLLISITQALDDVFITPFRQLKLAVDSLASGASTVLSLPSTLLSNAKGAGKITLAVAESRNSNGTNPLINFSIGNPKQSTATNTVTIVTDSFGNITSTGPADAFVANSSTSLGLVDNSAMNANDNILNADGSLSQNLNSKQYLQVVDIMTQLDNDSTTPLPRAFVATLRDNTVSLRNDLADAVGLGSSDYNAILNRTVTHPAPPLATPSDDDFALLGALQDVIRSLNLILSNNEFFQSGADGIYEQAQQVYGAITTVSKPTSVREVTVQYGDTLELIALRAYGDALRWTDLVILNRLKAPYVLDEVVENPPEGVKMPGEVILVGVE